MKGFMKAIAFVAACAVAAVTFATVIDILYKKSTKYFTADESDE